MCFLMPCAVSAQELADDEEQSQTRQGMVTFVDTTAVLTHSAQYPFICRDCNRIEMNGDDWSELGNKLMHAGDDRFTIVHIGDSHLQADISTGNVRNLFQQRFGNAGRGLICPYKICGTNEPYSYHFTTSSKVASSKLLKKPWSTDMGFTGTSFMPFLSTYDVEISTVTTKVPDGSPFDAIRIYADNTLTVSQIVNENDSLVPFVVCEEDYYVDIILEKPAVSAKMTLFSPESAAIFGMSLTNGNSGVLYHTIGNNGATYATYNELQTVGHDVSTLSPDLVIISLGTNEAYSKITPEEMTADIDYMIANIRRYNPTVKILLTTPMETQRKKTSYVRRNGKRRRVRSFIVNTKIAEVRQTIVKYARENHVPLYDFYSIAGAEGASNRWASNNLMAKDNIHNTYMGYLVKGELLYEALINALMPEE